MYELTNELMNQLVMNDQNYLSNVYLSVRHKFVKNLHLSNLPSNFIWTSNGLQVHFKKNSRGPTLDFKRTYKSVTFNVIPVALYLVCPLTVYLSLYKSSCLIGWVTDTCTVIGRQTDKIHVAEIARVCLYLSVLGSVWNPSAMEIVRQKCVWTTKS